MDDGPRQAPDSTPSDPATIGPLDEGTIRPVRTLVTAKLVSMLLVLLCALGSAVLLAPQLGSVLGFAKTVEATVTELTPFESDSTTCVREQVHVTWGQGRTGFFVTCAGGQSGADMAVAVGDRIEVRALAGWDSVVVGDRWPNVVVTLVLVAVAAVSILLVRRYRRERAALVAAGREPVAGSPIAVTRTGLAFAVDVLSMGKGKRATAKLAVEGHDPLRIQVPGTSAAAMDWRTAQLHPLGRTRSGGAAGPYVLRLPTGGVIVASGRPLRPADPA